MTNLRIASISLECIEDGPDFLFDGGGSPGMPAAWRRIDRIPHAE
jgi:hypothetical protein